MNIGFALRVAMLKKDIQQKDVAENLGISKQYLQQMLKGDRKLSEKRLAQILESINVTEEYINKLSKRLDM